MVFIHPYDDPDVIAGQGTIAMEILRHTRGAAARDLRAGGRRRLDRRGIAAYVKALYPEIKIIGVEPEDAPTLHAGLAAGASG